MEIRKGHNLVFFVTGLIVFLYQGFLNFWSHMLPFVNLCFSNLDFSSQQLQKDNTVQETWQEVMLYYKLFCLLVRRIFNKAER